MRSSVAGKLPSRIGSATSVSGPASNFHSLPSGETLRPCGPSFSMAISPTGVVRSSAAPEASKRMRWIRSADSAPTYT